MTALEELQRHIDAVNNGPTTWTAIPLDAFEGPHIRLTWLMAEALVEIGHRLQNVENIVKNPPDPYS